MDLFEKVIDRKIPERPITRYYFVGSKLSHFLKAEKLGNNKIIFYFETCNVTKGFFTEEERDKYLIEFMKQYREVTTIG